jgi:polar amino acid transport system substrate-binding protein
LFALLATATSAAGAGPPPGPSRGSRKALLHPITTGLAYIYDHIHPTQSTRVYNTLDEAVAALQTKQIDAIVVDTPDGQYMATSEVKTGVQVGQFPSTGEHYGLLFHKGNPLVVCVDSALTVMGRDGALASLSKQYLGIYNSIPILKP